MAFSRGIAIAYARVVKPFHPSGSSTGCTTWRGSCPPPFATWLRPTARKAVKRHSTPKRFDRPTISCSRFPRTPAAYWSSRSRIVARAQLAASHVLGGVSSRALAIVVAASEHRCGSTQRHAHLGSPARVDLGKRFHRLESAAVGCLHQARRRNLVHHIVERDRTKPVARSQRVDHVGCRSTGCHHLSASHTSRSIDHKHDIARLCPRPTCARWNQGQHECAPLTVRIIGAYQLAAQSGCFCSGVDAPSQNEVAIELFFRLHNLGRDVARNTIKDTLLSRGVQPALTRTAGLARWISRS